jgi:hypothetical protein
MKVLEEETSAVTRLARLRSMVFDAVERCRLLRPSPAGEKGEGITAFVVGL